MAIKKELIADFAIDFYSKKSFDDAFDAYSQLIQKTGFDGVLYSYVPQISIASKLSIPPIFKSSEAYNKFLEYYFQHRLDKTDFVLKALRNGETNILDWWEEAEKRELPEAEFAQVRLARERFNIVNGIIIPTMSNQRGFAGASLITSKDGDAYEELKSEYLETIALCTRMFHDFTLSRPLSSNTFILPYFPDLTSKEIDVLRYQLTGQPMKMIEESTGISPKYAEKLLMNIRKKFGSISKNELIHQTSAFNLLDGL